MLPIITLIVVTFATWFPVLNFWFFQGWEQSWLMGNCGGYNFNFQCIMQGHSLLYLIDYKLFGWNPMGWYLTSIILHTLVVILIYLFIKQITHNRLLAFVSSLLFTVSIAYYDVITWGSFNSLYSFQMIIFLLASIFYFKLRTEKIPFSAKTGYYLLILCLFIIGLFVRESAILLPFLLIFEELFILYQIKWTKKRFLHLFFLFAPLFFIIAFFIHLKSGLSSYDQIDGSVQFSESLLSRREYVEYIKRTLLTFGLLVGPHMIPFDFLNKLRNIVFVRFPNYSLHVYFFSAIGLAYISLQLLFIAIFWKKKQMRNMLFFAFLWFMIPEIFACFVISYSNDSLLLPYNVNIPPRYRYFAFFGTVLFWTNIGQYYFLSLLRKYKKIAIYFQYALATLIIGILLFNFFYLRNIQTEMYLTRYAPEKSFFSTFLKDFKTLPKDYTFYVYPASGPLKDYVAELYHVRQAYYPNLTEERTGVVEHQGGRILERLAANTISLDNVYFLDYSSTKGLQDYTKQAREIFKNPAQESYAINQTFPYTDSPSPATIYDQQLTPPLHVEVPYNLSLTASSQALDQTLNDPKQQAMHDYVEERTNLLQNTHVSVCGTISEGTRKEALQVSPYNLIDGNISSRSTWVADCRPTAWIMYDLGEERAVGGIAFANEGGPSSPVQYSIEVSKDQKNWDKILSITDNDQTQRINLFPHIITTRYIRMTIVQTKEGALPSLEELQILGKKSLDLIASYKNNFAQLLHDSYLSGGAFMKITWTTEPNNFLANETEENNSIYIPIVLDGVEHEYKTPINETENFSSEGQFLKRMITKLRIDFTGIPSMTNLEMIHLTPRFQIKNSERTQQ